VICTLCCGLGSEEEEGKSIQVPALEKLMAVSVHHLITKYFVFSSPDGYLCCICDIFAA